MNGVEGGGGLSQQVVIWCLRLRRSRNYIPRQEDLLHHCSKLLSYYLG